MPSLPLIRDTTPGLYAVCTAANTGYTIAIPATATGCVLWFESGGSLTGGRVGVDQASTAVTGITGTDTTLGYHPPMPVEYTFRPTTGSFVDKTWTETPRDAFIHVASATAGTLVKGMWLYSRDNV